jgi:hypothetical protein
MSFWVTVFREKKEFRGVVEQKECERSEFYTRSLRKRVETRAHAPSSDQFDIEIITSFSYRFLGRTTPERQTCASPSIFSKVSMCHQNFPFLVTPRHKNTTMSWGSHDFGKRTRGQPDIGRLAICFFWNGRREGKSHILSVCHFLEEEKDKKSVVESECWRATTVIYPHPSIPPETGEART